MAKVLKSINVLRREVGDDELVCWPKGSRKIPDDGCPVARALTALVLPREGRISFHYPWYAAASAKPRRVPFMDAFLMSVAISSITYEFAVSFRAGAFPELEEHH